FVVIGKPLGEANNITYVDNDNVKASRAAAEFLINRGHKKIGYIGGSLKFEVAKYRLQGFKEAVLLNQLNLTDDNMKKPESPDLIVKAVKELMPLNDHQQGLLP